MYGVPLPDNMARVKRERVTRASDDVRRILYESDGKIRSDRRARLFSSILIIKIWTDSNSLRVDESRQKRAKDSGQPTARFGTGLTERNSHRWWVVWTGFSFGLDLPSRSFFDFWIHCLCLKRDIFFAAVFVIARFFGQNSHCWWVVWTGVSLGLDLPSRSFFDFWIHCLCLKRDIFFAALFIIARFFERKFHRCLGADLPSRSIHTHICAISVRIAFRPCQKASIREGNSLELPLIWLSLQELFHFWIHLVYLEFLA